MNIKDRSNINYLPPRDNIKVRDKFKYREKGFVVVESF